MIARLGSKLIVPVLLAFSLVLGIASTVAHAAPKSPPPPQLGPLGTCSAVATRTSDWDISWSGSGNGHYTTRAVVQEQAETSGVGCGVFRVRVAIWAQSGYQYYGTFGNLKTPGGSSVLGSSFNDSTVYTGASSWRYFYGPWVSVNCSTGVYGYGGSYRYNPVDGSSGNGGGLTYYC